MSDEQKAAPAPPPVAADPAGKVSSPAVPGGNPRDADLKDCGGIPEDARGANPGSMVTGG